MCALWLHHGDHSLARLSWVAATPGQKKKTLPSVACLLHTGVRPVGCTLLQRGYAPLWSREGLAVRCVLLDACVTVLGLRFRGSLLVEPFASFGLVQPFP